MCCFMRTLRGVIARTTNGLWPPRDHFAPTLLASGAKHLSLTSLDRPKDNVFAWFATDPAPVATLSAVAARLRTDGCGLGNLSA
jgi:hypothetical protein